MRIRSLSTEADIYTVISELPVEFGQDVKRLNYKQIAIVYTIYTACLAAEDDVLLKITLS